jgi:hypothetical protein
VSWRRERNGRAWPRQEGTGRCSPRSPELSSLSWRSTPGYYVRKARRRLTRLLGVHNVCPCKYWFCVGHVLSVYCEVEKRKEGRKEDQEETHSRNRPGYVTWTTSTDPTTQFDPVTATRRQYHTRLSTTRLTTVPLHVVTLDICLTLLSVTQLAREARHDGRRPVGRRSSLAKTRSGITQHVNSPNRFVPLGQPRAGLVRPRASRGSFTFTSISRTRSGAGARTSGGLNG